MMNPEAAKIGSVTSGSGSSKYCHHYRKRSNTLESGMIEKRRASHAKVRRDSSGSIPPLTSGYAFGDN